MHSVVQTSWYLKVSSVDDCQWYGQWHFTVFQFHVIHAAFSGSQWLLNSSNWFIVAGLWSWPCHIALLASGCGVSVHSAVASHPNFHSSKLLNSCLLCRAFFSLESQSVHCIQIFHPSPISLSTLRAFLMVSRNSCLKVSWLNDWACSSLSLRHLGCVASVLDMLSENVND